MATEFRLPELGENIEAGDVVRVAVTAGESIEEGQTVIELETDKAVIEVPSTVSGVIEEVSVTASQRVKVGDVLFTYSAADSSAKPAEAEAPKAAADAEKTRRKTQPNPQHNAKRAAQGAVPELRGAAVNAASAEFRLPELGENIESGDVVRVTVEARRGSDGGPDGAGTGDRQGSGGGSFDAERNGQRGEGEGGAEAEGGRCHLHGRRHGWRECTRR